MPLVWASRNAGGMIVSARLRPITSSRVHPNVASACAFHATICAGRIHADKGVVRGIDDQVRARVALGQTWLSACAPLAPRRWPRRSGCAIEMAKFCSSTVQARGPPDVLDAQHTDDAVVAAQRHVEHRADVVRLEIRGQELARRGSVRASCAAMTRSRSIASK